MGKGKGSMVSLFSVGQVIVFRDNDESGKAIDRVGRITKLHKSCTCGVAEIHPLDEKGKQKKLARKLRGVHNANAKQLEELRQAMAEKEQSHE